MTKEVAKVPQSVQTEPPDSLCLDLVKINDRFITWKVTTCRLQSWLSSNLCYLKCTSEPERWLVLSSANCQLTELIRTVKTRTPGSHSTDCLTKWWEVCWWAISTAQQWVPNYYTQRSKCGTSSFFFRHQPKGHQQSQKELILKCL